MAEFPKIEEMSKKVAEKALDEFLYKGKSIREWAQIIASEDAISRQAVLDVINTDWHEDLSQLEDAIKALPPVEPKTGHWILKRTFPTKLYDEYLNEYKCSECYREIRCTESQLVNYPYCHCGAKMQGVEECI